MFKIEEKNDRVIFRLRVRPAASRNEIKGFYGEALKVNINAPSIKGRANKECIRFLAKELRISKSDIEILSGLKSKNKLIKIKRISKEKVLKALSPK